MYWTIFKYSFFLLLSAAFIINPRSSYANFCTITDQLFFKPTLVIAKAKNQTINCEDYQTTTYFDKFYTIKGTSADQFDIKTINPNTKDVCKTSPTKLVSQYVGTPNPQFETGKKYLLSFFPPKDPNSLIVDLNTCSRSIVTEVNGLLDLKVIINIIIVYTQPIWMIEFIPTILLGLLLYRFIPNIFSFILSGIIVLILNGIAIVLLFRFVRKIIRKIKNTQKATNS